MAVAFAEMHDTPVRMVAKGVLHGIVPWAQARPFLATRLRRRCDTGVQACVWMHTYPLSGLTNKVPLQME